MSAIRGSCLCGGVKFEITGPLTHLFNCHCSKCRKQHGAAFRSRARVRVEDFQWLQGEELVSYYESSPGFRRGFCSRCGSPIVNRPSPNYKWAAVRGSDLGVPLGILDNDPGVRPLAHIFVASKAPWFEISDDLPQHTETGYAEASSPSENSRASEVVSPGSHRRTEEDDPFTAIEQRLATQEEQMTRTLALLAQIAERLDGSPP